MITSVGNKLLRPAIFALLAFAAPTWASAQAPQRTATTIGVTPVFASKDASQTPIRVASAGSVLLLIEAERDWCLVEYQDPALGRRTGFVETKNVRISGGPEATPEPTRLTPPTGGRPASPGRRAAPKNVYLNINYLSFTPHQDVQTYTFVQRITSESASVTTAYPTFPRVSLFPEIGADVRLGSAVGVGFLWTAIDYEYSVALLASVPHPTRLNTFGNDVTITDVRLNRRDRSFDFIASYFVPTPDVVVLKIFGGPTYFSISQEMVDAVRYSQSFTAISNAVNITGFTQQEVKGHAWGFNVGGDAAYFFSRYVGVGGTARYNRGNVSITEPLTGQPADLKAGGTMVGGGLRLRF